MSQKALDIIREVKEKRLTRLDLGNCGLTELPPEALECDWVEELILSGNWWQYSFEKKQFARQSSRNKGDRNNITTLPLLQTHFPDLKNLISNSIQITDLSPLAGLSNLQELDCSNNQITDLSPVAGLTNLQILDFYSTQITDLSPLSNLFNLQQLDCESTQVSDLSSLSNLFNLQQLNCSRTQVSDLSPLSNLANLRELYCNSNQITDLSPVVGLTNLQILYCNSNQITDLSPVAGLIHLQILYCYSNQITDLSPVAGLTNLQQLGCSDNQIIDLSQMAGLTNLQEFYCYSNQIIDLSPLAGLIHLQMLYCYSNQITDLSPVTGLTNLQQLNCESMQVSDLSPLAGLTNLQILNCSSNQITDLSPLKNIIERGVPVKWNRSGFGIMIEDCPLQNPPIEIAKQGNEAILRYWTEQARVGTQKVNEARLLLVGQGGAGKTTLKEKLRDRKATMPAPDATTKTIHIEPLVRKAADGADFTLQVWDFGGQNIQKYAHQFFMSDSVVYALLSNTREQNPNFQYWLNIIEMLGKDSPFFIVQNEKDGHAESLKDISQIQERFPATFQSVEQVNLQNAETDPRFDILERRLLYAATNLPHTQKEYPVSFINVRKTLEELSKTEQTISFKQFKDLCKVECITDPKLMDDYARTFTSLGIALHFSDDLHLKNQVFLRPKWIIDALFGLLYAPVVEAQEGRFSASDTEAIWIGDEYEGLHGVLVQLMVRFKLCYELPKSQGYIVPQRLRTRMEPFVPPPDATHLVYRYRFLPSGILTQLTCTLHSRIEADKAWNDAVQFSTKSGQGRVFVRENTSADSIEVFGYGQDKADLLNAVVDAMDEIHDTTKFGNLKVEKLVPCPCAVCATARTHQEPAEFFDYDFLIKLLKKGITESDRCKLSMDKFPIRDILKASNIRVFKIEEVKKLLENNQIKEALQLLSGQFPEDAEVILHLSRIAHHNRTDRMGILDHRVSDSERNRIVADVLAMLEAWER